MEQKPSEKISTHSSENRIIKSNVEEIYGTPDSPEIINRRSFIKRYGPIVPVAMAVSSGSTLFLSYEPDVTAPEIPGWIHSDLHAYIGKDNEKKVLEALTEKLVGINYQEAKKDKWLLYEDLIKMNGVTEITPGILAKIEYNGKIGYAIKCQEFTSDNHILGIGIKEYVKEPYDANRAIELIRNQDGAIALVHPLMIPGKKGKLASRLVEADIEDYDKIVRLAYQSDILEEFNARIVNLIPGIMSLEEEKEIVQHISEQVNKPTYFASDTHGYNKTLGKSGIYLPVPNSSEEVVKNLKTGHFSKGLMQRMDRWDWLMNYF